MRYQPALSRGRLLRRYKRFLADVETCRGQVLTVHCPNTGAMTGCADPGSEVWYSVYPHTLEVVCSRYGRVGINTARANALVAEALELGRLPDLVGCSAVRREAPIPGGSGRFDFRLDYADRPCWLEVKSMTLCDADGRGAFPDAVSERALRHLRALQARRRAGDRAVLLFCVQHTGVRYATAADEIDPGYGRALREARDAGVEVLAFGCAIEPDEISLTDPVPVRL